MSLVEQTARPLGANQAEPIPRLNRFGWQANICALGSIMACFSQPLLVTVVGVLGLPITGITSHLQAVLMWALALLALIGLGRDHKAHRNNKPIVVGVVSLAIIVGTLYVHYHWAILTLAYLLLISAVFMNQTAMLSGLYDRVQRQARELADWNETLTQRVAEQVARIEKLDRLRRFLSPQVAELIINAGEDTMLASHRRDVAALFCDLRGFTSFSERIEPEEAMEILRTYHLELDRLINKHNGMIDHRAGDGVLVIFNDPVPCEKPMETTLQLALEMRARVRELGQDWKTRGYDLGFGIGIASGFATLGVIGAEGRFDYTANGNVINLACRLCDAALNDQILLSQRAHAEIEHLVNSEPLPPLELKGLRRPVQAFNVLSARAES
jgi:class 3 adenylate cyclase